MTEDLEKFAEDLSRAIEEGILGTQSTFRIPFTGITIGWNRMQIVGVSRTRLIEIRIWWRQ